MTITTNDPGYLEHVRVTVDNIERNCDIAEGLTVSGGRGRRLGGHPDAAVAGFTLRVAQADVPNPGAWVSIQVFRPRTDPAIPESWSVIFQGRITDMSATLRDDGLLNVAVNAADFQAWLAAIQVPGWGSMPTTSLSYPLAAIQTRVNALSPYGAGIPPDARLPFQDPDFVTKLSPGTSWPIGTNAYDNPSSALEFIRTFLDMGAWTMFSVPNTATGLSPTTAANVVVIHDVTAARWSAPDYPYTSVPQIPCEVIVADPAVAVSISGRDYVNNVIVSYGNQDAQLQTAYRAPPPGPGLDQSKAIQTILANKGSADQIAREWAYVAANPQPMWTVTILYLTTVLDNMAPAAADAVSDAILELLRWGCGQVALPVDIDVNGDGQLSRMHVENVKVTWHWDGWIIDLGLSPQAAYANKQPSAWPPVFFIQSMPGPVLNLAGAPTDTTIVLTWDPPTDPGAGPVTRYDIEWRHPTASTWSTATVPAGTTTYTIPNLSPGITGWQYRVRAVNAYIDGPWATSSADTTGTTTGWDHDLWDTDTWK